MLVMTWAGERFAAYWAASGTAALAVALLGPPGGWLLAVVGVACLAIACRVPGEGLRLVGPVARYELVRATRRRRVILWRALVAAGLLLAVAGVYDDVQPSRSMAIGQIARFGEAVAWWILGGLWMIIPLMVVLIAPAVVAEDRERKQLDFALVTDLRSREVVFGRLLAGLAEAAALALVAVPLLALLPLFGGVDPAALACSLTLLCSTALAIAGLGALASASSRTVGAASWRLGVGLAAFGVVSLWAAAYLPGLAASPAGVLLAANPFALATVLPGGGSDAAAMWRATRPTLAAHVLLFLGGSSLAVARMRAVAAWAGATLARRARPRPPIGDTPALEWRGRWSIRRACPAWRTLAVVASLFGVLMATVWANRLPGNVFVRCTGGVTLALHLLLVGRAITRQFDQYQRSETRDLLRLTPLTGAEVVAQKRRAAWRGGGRRTLVALATLWTLSACAGWIVWWTVPILLVMTAVAHDATVALAIRLGVSTSGRSARTLTLLWVGSVVGSFVFAGMTWGQSLCLNPAAGVLMWAGSARDFDRVIDTARTVLEVHLLLTLLVPFIAWYLRRSAAARFRLALTASPAPASPARR